MFYTASYSTSKEDSYDFNSESSFKAMKGNSFNALARHFIFLIGWPLNPISKDFFDEIYKPYHF